MTGERLSMVRIAGIICTLVGVVVVAGGEKRRTRTMLRPCAEAAAESAGPSSLLFGFAVLFWLLGIRVIPRVGAIQNRVG